MTLNKNFNAYHWNTAARRYVTSSGKIITPKDASAVARDLAATTRDRMKLLGEQVAGGKLTRPKFQLAMAAEVKKHHTAMAVIAKGGRAQMTAKDWGKLGARLKFQYKKLEAFVKAVPHKIEDRKGTIAPRAGQYGESGVGTYENFVRAREQAAGMKEERRRYGGTENHCKDCKDQIDLGWQPVGVLKDIGDTQCGGRDGCYFEFR